MNYNKVTDIYIPGIPSESQIHFKKDGTAIMLVRREQGGDKAKGFMGESHPPYTKWEWTELDIYLAGHDFLIDENGIVVVTRLSQSIGQRTVAWYGDEDGNFEWCQTLPYGGHISDTGDTAYASILKEGNEYWISYYAIQEDEKPSIFFVKIPRRNFTY